MVALFSGLGIAGVLLLWHWGPRDPAKSSGRAAPPSLAPEVAQRRLRRPVYDKPPLGRETEVGEMGRPARLELTKAEQDLQEESIQLHQINIFLSDRISLHRRLPERRNPL